MRTLVAGVLRAVVSIALGLAILLTALTAIGIVVILAGDGEAAGFGLGEILPMWLGCVALALALARLAYLALGRIVEIRRP